MRLAIGGCGLIGRKRAAAASGHEIVVVCDRDEGRARELAGITKARAVTDWQHAIKAGVDAVFVATTHDQLAGIAIAAIEAGRHVLVEKPAGRTLAEVQAVAAAAAKHKRIVKTGFNHRFHPAFKKAREIVDSSALGPLLFIRARYGHGGRVGYEKEWRAQPAISGGGELIDQGSHLIDLSRWFLGDLTVDYAAVPTLFWDMQADDNCFMALRSTTGRLAWLHASWTEWKNTFSFEIFGRDGKLVVDGLGGSYGQERLTSYRMLPEMGPPETEVFEFSGPDQSWEKEFADFAAAIENGRRPCGDITDAVANLAIVEDIYRRFRP